MNSPANFTSNLNFSQDKSSFNNSMIIGISVTIMGLGFFLVICSFEVSLSVVTSTTSESAMISLSVRLGVF